MAQYSDVTLDEGEAFHAASLGDRTACITMFGVLLDAYLAMAKPAERDGLRKVTFARIVNRIEGGNFPDFVPVNVATEAKARALAVVGELVSHGGKHFGIVPPKH